MRLKGCFWHEGSNGLGIGPKWLEHGFLIKLSLTVQQLSMTTAMTLKEVTGI